MIPAQVCLVLGPSGTMSSKGISEPGHRGQMTALRGSRGRRGLKDVTMETEASPAWPHRKAQSAKVRSGDCHSMLLQKELQPVIPELDSLQEVPSPTGFELCFVGSWWLRGGAVGVGEERRAEKEGDQDRRLHLFTSCRVLSSPTGWGSRRFADIEGSLLGSAGAENHGHSGCTGPLCAERTEEPCA